MWFVLAASQIKPVSKETNSAHLQRALLYIESFKEKSKECEKQLQLREDELEEQLLLREIIELKAHERGKIENDELERKIEAKKTLELEIESIMRSDIKVTKQKDDDDKDMVVIKKKMEELERDVKEKEEKLEEMEKLYGASSYC
ncbi:hypothetical protein Q3G72_000964 [Acer saccharum]|nr:hypothetical protein Q3G72_000964 [Acer saccharum]